MKKCTKCKIEKSRDEFHRDRQRSDGLHSVCKICKRADRNRIHAETMADPERHAAALAYQRIYREKNSERTNGYTREWMRKEREENPERARERRNQWYAENPRDPEARWSERLRGKYGLTLDSFQALAESQGRCCALCGKHESMNKNGRLYVDHCHETGKVRGLLCHKCNLGLGFVGDTVSALQRALDYVRGESDRPNSTA